MEGKRIRPTELSGNPISNHLLANQDELAKEMMKLALRSSFVHTSKGSLIRRTILRHGADGFTSPTKEERCAADFIALKNPSPSARFEPAHRGPSDKHANNYTTEDNGGLVFDEEIILKLSYISVL
jgi:hypothetical protein